MSNFPQNNTQRFELKNDIVNCDIIGDVHGCYDELIELLKKLGHNDIINSNVKSNENPKLIFVGDLVDRGEKIVDTLMLVLRLCKLGYALCVLGNHDWKFYKWLLGRNVEVNHGLEESINEINLLDDEKRNILINELIAFYENAPLAVICNDNKLVVAHAAWHNELKSASPHEIRAYTMYGPITGNKTIDGYPERVDWAVGYKGPELVVFGHQVYKIPYVNSNSIGIDTGCVYGGYLTALKYPTLEVVQIKSNYARYKSKRLEDSVLEAR
ncbi:MAG: metallophosphoesterase [Chlorobiota bacterium]|jgi:hypothetical protein|nr:metallophosphoesterase [Chlorobiota bacterium]QQS66291.1 MAG: metallophosphoesterase [Chlorobiota bacterium]